MLSHCSGSVDKDNLHVAIMSPNRYWCEGVETVSRFNFREGLVFSQCSSLASLKVLLGKNHASVLITEPYGQGDNIIDWFTFCDWKKSHFPALQVIVLINPARMNLKVLQRDTNTLAMNASMGEVVSTLRKIYRRQLGYSTLIPCRPILTLKEACIIKYLCQEVSQTALSKLLGVHVKTINSHKVNALRKLGMRNIGPLLGCQSTDWDMLVKS